MLSSLRRSSQVARYGRQLSRALTGNVQSNQVEKPNVNCMDVWDYELVRNNAGAFGMQYIVSHPTTQFQSSHIMWAASLTQQIMGYIAGTDGLSEAEIDLLCENQELLCPDNTNSNVAKDNLEIGASFTEKELSEAITG